MKQKISFTTFLKSIIFTSFLLAPVACRTSHLPTSADTQIPAASSPFIDVSSETRGIPATTALVSPSSPALPVQGSNITPTLGPQEIANSTPAITAVQGSLPIPARPRSQYDLQAELDYAAHTLAVEEAITYLNDTPVSLAALPLVVEARRHPGAFQLNSISNKDGERLTDFQWKDTLLTLVLLNEIPPGEKTRLTISYTLHLPDVDTLSNLPPHPLGYTSLQANFGDWYPFIPPYDPVKGWLVHPPAMYGEHLVYDIADFTVAIHILGNQSNLVVAASSPAIQDGEWLRYTHNAARSFAWSASPHYQVASQDVQTVGGQAVSVESYYFPFHEQAGKSMLESMARAIELFSHLFGPYPHPKLSGVQAGFMDGMEYDGLFFLSTDFYNWYKDSPADFLVALAAHEVAHQWWSGLVGNDQAMQPWLDEALCTYSERLFYENVFPEALAWWWDYRVNYYQPEGWVDTSIYDVPQVVRGYRQYRDPVYLRGALFLEELRTQIGEEAFFATLRQYSSQYAYRQASAEDFLSILHSNTNTDLENLIRKYFQHLE